MEQRINAFTMGSKTINALHGLGHAVKNSAIEPPLLELIYFRVSQINGCAFCLDMHAKNLRAYGETEQRIYLLSAWQEAPFFTEKERSALAWAEALTILNQGGLVPDNIYSKVKKHFSETEIVDLTMAIIAINGYNRVNIAFGKNAASYEIPVKN